MSFRKKTLRLLLDLPVIFKWVPRIFVTDYHTFGRSFKQYCFLGRSCIKSIVLVKCDVSKYPLHSRRPVNYYPLYLFYISVNKIFVYVYNMVWYGFLNRNSDLELLNKLYFRREFIG